VINKKFWAILEAIMLVIWIITLIIFLIQLFSDSTKCMNNPLIYGVNKLSVQNNETLTCKCQYSNQLDKIIFVDSKHWEWQKTNFNFTG